MSARPAKDWFCPECKRWMTLAQARRAIGHGCLAGCSGIDIEHHPDGRPLPPPIPVNPA